MGGKWWRLCDKYEIVPVEYGNWIDSHVLGDRDLTTEESLEMLKRDIRLAHRLGFKVMRTKMPVINDLLEPVENWREIIKGALPLAEELDIQMCPEIHTPSNLKGKLVTDFVEFIRETGTKHFGLNIDFQSSEQSLRKENGSIQTLLQISRKISYRCCHMCIAAMQNSSI